MHDGLAISLSEAAVEAAAVVLRQVVSYEWLAAILVDALENLALLLVVLHFPCLAYFISRRVSETRKEREESSRHRGCGRISEDDLVEM